ncbi:MAG: putative sulfate exporter family transporter [Chitinophagales bacterium]|nr:putative sulfate exporter family transporter [Chitinophagales bacterium]
MQKFIRENFYGLMVSLILGLVAHFLAPLIPNINGVILAFLLAVVLGNFIKLPDGAKEGVNFSSSKLLEIAIIFLAFSINFKSIANLGWQKFTFLILMVFLVLSATIVLAKLFKTKDSTAWLVGFGTAICGSSAIAAVAPVISKNKEDAGIAIAVVNLLGSLGMIVLPFALAFFVLEDSKIGFILGASLQSVGNVAGAGYGLGQEIGDAAITVKLARVALLSPAVILFSFFINRGEGAKEGEKISFSLPYYLWLFIAITIANSLLNLPSEFLDFAKELGNILLTISMAAIGLKVSFKSLWQSGKMAIGFGLIIFAVQTLLAVLAAIIL